MKKSILGGMRKRSLGALCHGGGSFDVSETSILTGTKKIKDTRGSPAKDLGFLHGGLWRKIF